ncbi:unnamed protein product [Chrysoparadoxa australica]
MRRASGALEQTSSVEGHGSWVMGAELLKGASNALSNAEGGNDEGALSRTAVFLDSEQGQAAAAMLVTKTEVIQDSPAIAGLLKTLADPAIGQRIMHKIEGLDADQLIEQGERALTDEGEQQALLNQVKDYTVSFLLDHLPHLEVPPVSGDNGKIKYTIDRLDMSGFQMAKEDVTVTLPGVKGKEKEVFCITASNIQARFKDLRWACDYGYGSSVGEGQATVEHGSIILGFSLKRGVLDPKLCKEEKPLLVLSRRDIDMEGLSVLVANTRMAWLVNTLAALFATTVKEYVRNSLLDSLDSHASELLGVINGLARDHWPVLLQGIDVEVTDLPPASSEEIKLANGTAVLRTASSFFVTRPGKGLSLGEGLQALDFSIIFCEEGSLGLKVDVVNEGSSPRVVVSDVPAQGQTAELLQFKSELLIGAEIVKVGDIHTCGEDFESTVAALKQSQRYAVDAS